MYPLKEQNQAIADRHRRRAWWNRAKGVGVTDILALSPAAWYRRGLGITESGNAVSAWADQSGNARDLGQSGAGAKPTLQSNGTILFDGTSDVMFTSNFTLNQPETVVILGKQVTWTINDRWFDGNADLRGTLGQLGTTPAVAVNAGSTAASNTGVTLDTWKVVQACFNGANSFLQVNDAAATTGNCGAANMGGFTLGANGARTGNFGNVQIAEVLVFPVALTTAQLSIIRRWLMTVAAEIGIFL